MTHSYTKLRVATTALACAGLLAACSDNNIPWYTAPTQVAKSAAGIQNAITGLFAGTRVDIGGFTTTFAAGYARDGAVFTNTESRTVEYPLGVFPTPTSSGTYWGQEYQNIVQAHQTLPVLPTVAPAYTSAQIAALDGVIETMIAYNYMLMAEAHDTLGIAIEGPDISLSVPQAVCNADAWHYIVAVLDSANADLTTAGSTTIPLVSGLPTGFASLSTAGPSTTVGTFASFNRALAAKANLELAYAIARTPTNGANAPTPTTPGVPDATSLTAALTALTASAMYNPAQLAPDPAGGFAASPYTVTWDYSSNSGDLVNPVRNEIGTVSQLNDFVVAVDTVHDLRWKAKFIPNPNGVQEPTYAPVAQFTKLDPSTGRDTTFSYIPNMYPNTSSPIPIIREVHLVLWHAQILLAQGNLAGALADVNLVRTTTGGLTAYPASDATSGSNPYVQVRNDLLAEQRISTTWESSADRTISLRMYGLAAVADTTWNGTEDPIFQPGKNIDNHTTVNPIPLQELSQRQEATFVTTCSIH